MNNDFIRVVENGIAYGNYNGQPFDYNISDRELTFVDPLGKSRTIQDTAIRFELEKKLRDYFSEEATEFRHNLARHNNQ